MNQTSSRHISQKSNVGRRFTIITIMFFGVILGLLGYTVTTLHKDQSISSLIDVAGLQRMLHQKHIHEVFLVSQGIAADYPSTREHIRTTLNTLIEGNPVVLEPETGRHQTASPPPTEELLTVLRAQLTDFDQIVKRADTFLTLGSDHPEFREQAQTLLDQNLALIGVANKAVQYLNAYSESNIATMVKWEIMIALAIGLVGIVVANQGIRAGRKLEEEISERKRAEAAFQESELFLNSIIENIPHMIFVKDAKTLQFLRFNKAGEDLVGHPKEAMIGKTDYDFFPKSEADFYTTKDQKVLADKTLLDIPEEVIQTKSQGTRYLHTKKIPIVDDHGIPQYLLGISEDITEQRLVKLEHTQQELLLRLTFETGPGCIKRVAADGTLLHMNPAGLDLIEAEEENEALGLSVFDLVVPEHVGAFKQMHQNVLWGKRQTLQFEVQGLKGGRRWMETYAVPFNNPITKEVEQLAVTHDITKRKATEEFIQKGEKRFRAIYEQAPTGIAVLDSLSGRFTQINQKYCDITGYSPEEMLDHTFQDITYPDDLQADLDLMQQLLAGQIHRFQMEKRYIRKDGEVIWVNLTCVPLWLESTDPRQHIAMVEDITERKKAEKKFRESEQKFRVMAETVPDILFTNQPDGACDFVSQRLYQYTGLPPDAGLGFGWAKALHSDDLERCKDKWLRTVNAGLPYEDRYRLISPNGTYRWFLARAIPIKNEEDRIEKWFGVSTDIHDLVKTEETLETLAKSTVSLGSKNFFENLVHQLANTFQVQMVFLAERVEETFPIVQGISFWHGDHFESKFEYDCLEGPCEKVFEGQPVYIPQRVQALFPTNPTVKALNLESYCGRPLFNSEGRVIGNLAIMDQKPLSLTDRDLSLLQICADRAGAELERKRAQEALQASEERYRTLYEDNPSMYFTVAQDGKILSVNQFGAQQLGHSAKELVGRPVLDLFLEDDQSQVLQRFKECLRHPLAVFSWEFRKVRKDKSVVWVKEDARSIYNKDGEIVVLIVCEDISERKKTEKELQEWKALTESILGQLPKGFAYRCLNNKHWTAIYVSDGIEEVTGFPASALLSEKINYDSLIAPGENERVWSDVQNALAKHLPYENEHQIITRAGEKKWILARGRFIFNKTGDLLYLDGLNVDITEQKKIQNALRTSEARFRSLVEHVPFCIHEIELNGKISSMNKPGQKMIGIENESRVVGRSYLKLTEEKDHSRSRDFFEQALQGQSVDFEFNYTKHGKVRYFVKRFIPIRGNDGTVLKVVGISEEITERKVAEKQLLESEAKRTEALLQSDALKSALLSSVSHELRTPLTAMKGSVSSIMGNGLSKMNLEQQDYLKGIDTEINYMSHLVDNLLDMSQIEAGTLIPHKEWHPLEDLLEGALRRTEKTVDTENIEIDIPENLPPVFVDAIEIQQVFINLLDNAGKYSSPSSPIRIHVNMEAHQISVRISNMGEPIQPQDLERIFERFYRRPPARKQPIRGTGLGLAICKGIVEAHGGRIWADSIGKEVEIAFTIPITESMPHFSLEGRHKS